MLLSLLLEFDRKDGKSNIGDHDFHKVSSWEHGCVLGSPWKGRVRPPEDKPGELCLRDPAGFKARLRSLHTIPITPSPAAPSVLHKTKNLESGLATGSLFLFSISCSADGDPCQKSVFPQPRTGAASSLTFVPSETSHWE